ncbi:MAG: HigA family addiction module antitoxin [Candidatus Cloacimonetes bacterium]|jgi:addiction module HigA family antidote|nr:HigA family addiction module antitoxin [Candidatus Cloacimonadota bacterium]MDD4560773.1 HigA family addiction module antitoxin [Candidatus Cloacimonadota bacterium]
MRKRYEFTPDYAVIPGETLQDTIESLDMTQAEFASRMGMTEQSLVRIIKGEQKITHETAQKLELVTGVSNEFWVKLEAQYQQQIKLIEERKRKVEYSAWLKQFPLKVLAERGYIHITKDPIAQAREVFAFFRTSSKETFEKDVSRLMASARDSVAYSTSPLMAATYVEMGIKDAETQKVLPYNTKAFREALKEAKAMIIDPPQDFGSKLQELFAKAGVALVFVPLFKGAHFNGVSKWLSSTKALIILSARGKAEDIFWFSLFHEAAHILHHSKKRLYISCNKSTNNDEEEAEQFAADYLIPASFNERILQSKSDQDLCALAKELGLSPGIVAGRYHHLTSKWNRFQHLIKKVDWE